MVYFFFITRPEGPIAHGHVGLHVFAIITDRSERAFGHFVSVGTEDHEIWPVTLNELVLRSNGIKNVSHAAGKADHILLAAADDRRAEIGAARIDGLEAAARNHAAAGRAAGEDVLLALVE